MVKKKNKKDRWVIRLHCWGGDPQEWLYLIDNRSGWTNNIRFAMQYPNKDLAMASFNKIIADFDLKKDLNKDNEEEIFFDVLDCYNIAEKDNNPLLFWETLHRSYKKKYIRYLKNKRTQYEQLKSAWEANEIAHGENVTLEVAQRRMGSHQWTIEEAISKPYRRRDNTTPKEKREEIEAVYKSRKIPIGKGVTLNVATKRYLEQGWTLREAIHTPKNQARSDKKKGHNNGLD